jgi:hypothetical protein
MFKCFTQTHLMELFVTPLPLILQEYEMGGHQETWAYYLFTQFLFIYF